MRLALSLLLLACAVGCDKSGEKKADPPAGMGDKAAPSTTPSAAPPGATVAIKGTQIPIKVSAEGFAPSEVKVEKGKETTLVFTRTSDKTCATEVEFPELKLKKDLPLNQPVAIVVPTGEARSLTFQCGMGMYKSKVVIQ